MFKKHCKVWLRKCILKLMAVLFTPHRVYMSLIHTQILRSSLIISSELIPIWREHMCFWVWFFFYTHQGALTPSHVLESVTASKSSPWRNKSKWRETVLPSPPCQPPSAIQEGLCRPADAVFTQQLLSDSSRGFQESRVANSCGATSSRTMILLSIWCVCGGGVVWGKVSL